MLTEVSTVGRTDHWQRRWTRQLLCAKSAQFPLPSPLKIARLEKQLTKCGACLTLAAIIVQFNYTECKLENKQNGGGSHNLIASANAYWHVTIMLADIKTLSHGPLPKLIWLPT